MCIEASASTFTLFFRLSEMRQVHSLSDVRRRTGEFVTGLAGSCMDAVLLLAMYFFFEDVTGWCSWGAPLLFVQFLVLLMAPAIGVAYLLYLSAKPDA